MKYVHFIVNTFRPSRSTQMFTVTYMVLSDTRQLPPGQYTLVPATYDQAKQYADSIGAEFIGCKPDPVEQPKVKAKLFHGGRGGGKSQANVPLKALDDARKIQGKGKYNTFTNYCFGDGYFARSCIDKYGAKVWEMANEIVSGEPK